MKEKKLSDKILKLIGVVLLMWMFSISISIMTSLSAIASLVGN